MYHPNIEDLDHKYGSSQSQEFMLSETNDFNASYTKSDDPFLKALEEIKRKIVKDIETDIAIDADSYENVARLKVCQKIEKLYGKLMKL